MLATAAVLLVVIFAAVIALPRFGDGGSSDTAAVELLLPEGPARASGVVVAVPVADLGHIPLDFPVEHVFHLVNGGAVRVELGRPSVAVLDGC